MCGDVKVANVVVSIVDAFHSRAVHAVLNDGLKRRTAEDRLAYDHVPPSRRFAVRANTHFDAMHVHRTVEASLNVIFTCPNQLYGSPGKTLRDCRRFALHVRIGDCAPAESASGHFSVKDDLLGLESEDFRNRDLIEGLRLGASPRLRASAIEANRRIQWLHWRVGKVWKMVLGYEPITLGDAFHVFDVAAGHRNLSRGASELSVLGLQLRRVRSVQARQIPFDLHAVARLFRRPELVGDNCTP